MSTLHVAHFSLTENREYDRSSSGYQARSTVIGAQSDNRRDLGGVNKKLTRLLLTLLNIYKLSYISYNLT